MWHRIGNESRKYWGEKGASILYTDGTHILLLRRSGKGDHANTWGTPGGRSEDGETSLGTAMRECKEELGKLPKPANFIGKLEDKDGHHIFTTFLCGVPQQFDVKLSNEHNDYGWFTFDQLKHMDVHPRLKLMFPQIRHIIEQKYKKNDIKNEMSGFASFINFKEMGGATGPAIYTGKHSPDWNWQGAPWSMGTSQMLSGHKHKKKKKKKV